MLSEILTAAQARLDQAYDDADPGAGKLDRACTSLQRLSMEIDAAGKTHILQSELVEFLALARQLTMNLAGGWAVKLEPLPAVVELSPMTTRLTTELERLREMFDAAIEGGESASAVARLVQLVASKRRLLLKHQIATGELVTRQDALAAADAFAVQDAFQIKAVAGEAFYRFADELIEALKKTREELASER